MDHEQNWLACNELEDVTCAIHPYRLFIHLLTISVDNDDFHLSSSRESRSYWQLCCTFAAQASSIPLPFINSFQWTRLSFIMELIFLFFFFFHHSNKNLLIWRISFCVCELLVSYRFVSISIDIDSRTCWRVCVTSLHRTFPNGFPQIQLSIRCNSYWSR